MSTARPGQPAPTALARRALAVGLAVGVALVAMWTPATMCEGESFSCLGWVVVTIFAMPVVAFVVGLIAGALLRLRRPWLLALLGPFAAFGIFRTTLSVLGPELPALLLSAVLAALAYLGIALLLRPGTKLVLRVVAAILAAAMIFLPGVIESELELRRETSRVASFGVPLLLAELDGYEAMYVTGIGGDSTDDARLPHSMIRSGSPRDAMSDQIRVVVTRRSQAPEGCPALLELVAGAACTEDGDDRWLVEGPEIVPTLVVYRAGGMLIALGPDDLPVASITVRVASAGEFAASHLDVSTDPWSWP